MRYGEPAIPGTILTFYITDENINTEHRAVMTISTAGLVDFTINGVPIPGPDSMVETGIDTSTFQIQLTLPQSVNGKPLQDGDVVVMTYHQKADYSGNPQTVTQSRVLTLTPPSPISGQSTSSSQSVRIGHDFTLRIYAPDFNRDSFTPDDISLNMVEFTMGGLHTTLADPAFHVDTGSLRETGPNTDTFEATFEIPKEVDGFPVELGKTLEFRFLDPNTPSSVYVRVGSFGVASPSPTIQHLIPPTMIVRTTNPIGTYVNYLNSTLLYGLSSPVCFPSSGSFFSIGKTTIACSAKDQQGNSVLKSFTINVILGQNQFPSWVKKLVGFWCGGDIDDNGLRPGIQYLVSHGIVSIESNSENQNGTLDKSTLCVSSQGQISDQTIYNFVHALSR